MYAATKSTISRGVKNCPPHCFDLSLKNKLNAKPSMSVCVLVSEIFANFSMMPTSVLFSRFSSLELPALRSRLAAWAMSSWGKTWQA
jgi:hypothetical protein